MTEEDDLPDALDRLGLGRPRPTLVLVGGAAGMAARQRVRLRPVFHALLRVVASVGGAVVDGGTDSGVMALMGDATSAAGGPSPLVGVAAVGTVALPGPAVAAAAGPVPLEPHHSHFVLVPGDNWGDESEWLSSVATALSGPHPSVTVLVNGGDTAWRDVEASVAAGRPVIVVAGSGRAADDMASAIGATPLLGARPGAERAPVGRRGYRLAASGLVSAVSLEAGSGAIVESARSVLGKG